VRHLRIVLSIALLLGLLSFASSDAEAAPTVFGSSGAWCWFADPRAVQDQGVTYAGWVDNQGSIIVGAREHATGRQVKVILRSRFQYNDHANPALHLRPDGHLLVFWSGHMGGRMYYRISTRPRDVTSWEPERTVPIPTDRFGITYPNPVQVGDRLYFFWRGLGFNPWGITSDDGGVTWGTPRQLLTDGFRHYVKYAADGRGGIVVAFNQQHPRTGPTNVYVKRFQSLPATPFTLAQVTRIYTASVHHGARAWVHDVAITPDGRPVVVYATFPSSTDHRYWFARWTGSRWDSHEIARAGRSMSVDPIEPHYSGGITLDHENPATAYLSRVRAGVFHVERWKTSDGGAHFAVTRVSTSNTGNYRPISPRGEPDQTNPSVLLMRGAYPSFTSYRTAIDAQWGPGGGAPLSLDGEQRVLGSTTHINADPGGRPPEPRNPLIDKYPED
jgi:hypothetical protein